MEAGQFNIETAFLYGDLEEELYMELPDGYIEYIKELNNNGNKNEIPTQGNIKTDDINKTTHCLVLKKAIYRLVQAARQWWKKFKEVLNKLGYKSSLAEPCLFVKDGDKKSFIMIYVDDGGIFSNDNNIKEVLDGLSKIFTVKYLGKMETFLGFKIIEYKERDTIWIHQPKLINNLKKVFNKYIENIRQHSTPEAP